MRLFPFDEYEMRARIFPALLITIPIWVLVFGGLPPSRSWAGVGLGSLLECSILYFLAGVARDRGSKLQPSLYQEWVGPPTTRLLRHKDSFIDPLTKERLKGNIAKLSGVTFPSEAQETADRQSADNAYHSATRALIEQRRDNKKFRLIFLENCSYGFARNLLGIKMVGVIIAVSCLLSSASLLYLQGKTPGLIAALATSLAATAMLVLVVNRPMVKRCAEAYAIALLRSCEPTQRAPRKAHGSKNGRNAS